MSHKLHARLEEIHRELVPAVAKVSGDLAHVEVAIIYSPGEPPLVYEALCTWPELLAALHAVMPRSPLYDPRVGPPKPIEEGL